jgi:cytochrome c-type biogenesis protein CcmF
VVGLVAAAVVFTLGVRSTLAVLSLTLAAFVTATIAVDMARATRARVRMGEAIPRALGGLLLRHNRRYGGFIVHLGILVIALGVTGSQAWSVQTETTVRRGEHAELAGYRLRFDGLAASEESNHFKVTGTFTVDGGHAAGTVLLPAKKFYPQEQSPIAYVDYRLGLLEDLYVVLGDFARDGSQATIKVQVNRLVSWIWIGGAVLTLGAALAVAPERRKPA